MSINCTYHSSVLMYLTSLVAYLTVDFEVRTRCSVQSISGKVLSLNIEFVASRIFDMGKILSSSKILW